MRNANNLWIGLFDFYSYLFPTFADGCLFDGLTFIKMSSNRAVVPVFKPGVGSSQQENRVGTQQEGMSNNWQIGSFHQTIKTSRREWAC